MLHCNTRIGCSAALWRLSQYFLEGYNQTMIVIGVDEAGRGPLAGPVVAGAAVLPAGFCTDGLTDSKKLSARAREDWYGRITADSIWAVGTASVKEIDTHNILQASLLAMRRAVDSVMRLLSENSDIKIYVDGNQNPHFPNIPPEWVKCIVGGDALVPVISAASVLAKATRDRMMHELGAEFPHYGWQKNMGYGTADHRRAISLHGPCPHHRKLFIRKIYGTNAIAA